jgi:predicted lipid-binding transport protein (Tim44 family)
MSFSRLTVAIVALTAAFSIFAADYADARAGRGGSFGSRGSKTFDSPPATNTAPRAAPVEKSITQKGAPASAQGAQAAGGAAAQASRFGGLRGLLMGGLLAAAFASIFGLGALASILGFVLQFALIAGAVYLVMAWLRARRQPAHITAAARSTGPTSAPSSGSASERSASPTSSLRDMLGRQSHGTARNGAAAAGSIVIAQADLDTFERLLGEVQTAYSREDIDRLAGITTPEMLSYFSNDLAKNAREGTRNEISGVKLLQGDVAEAWREGGSDYATVAMRYALVDAMLDKSSGQAVSGHASEPSEATELWTFRRDQRTPSEGWQLSAIQQAA